MRHVHLLQLALLFSACALAGLAGCAPEEESTGFVRPKSKPGPTPTAASTRQLHDDRVAGGIKDRGSDATLTATPTNPPDPEPTPLPTWTPETPPSLGPIIVPSSDPGTDASPTPDAAAPTAAPDTDSTAP